MNFIFPPPSLYASFSDLNPTLIICALCRFSRSLSLLPSLFFFRFCRVNCRCLHLLLLKVSVVVHVCVVNSTENGTRLCACVRPLLSLSFTNQLWSRCGKKKREKGCSVLAGAREWWWQGHRCSIAVSGQPWGKEKAKHYFRWSVRPTSSTSVRRVDVVFVTATTTTQKKKK